MMGGELLVSSEQSDTAAHFRVVISHILDGGVADGELLGGERRPFFGELFEIVR